MYYNNHIYRNRIKIKKYNSVKNFLKNFFYWELLDLAFQTQEFLNCVLIIP